MMKVVEPEVLRNVCFAKALPQKRVFVWCYHIKMIRKETKGSIALIFLTSLYGLYGIFSRLIGETFGVFTQNFIVNLIIFIFLGLVFIFGNTKLKPIRKEDFFWLSGWLLSGSVLMLFLFLAFLNLGIGTVYFLFYSTMIISSFIFGKLFFKEKVDFIKMIAIVLSFFGLIFVYSISVDISKIIYIFYSLIAGLILGFYNTVSKKFSNNYSNSQLVFLLCLITMIVAGIGMFLSGEKMPRLSFSLNWVLIVIYGFVQMASTNLIIYSYKNLDVQIATLIMPVEIVFGVIFGFLFFRETISLAGVIGGILIVLAAVLPNIYNLMKSKK